MPNLSGIVNQAIQTSKYPIILDQRLISSNMTAPQVIDWSRIMAKVCEITGARVRRGGKIHRSGLAKKKGGIGRHVTKVIKRDVSPNLRKKRIWVPELNKYVKVKLTARALKTVAKNGAYATLKKAGIIKN
jgi:large subunit ribosomal protein L28